MRPTDKTNKNKASTSRGEGRAKLISALTLHHQYAEGGCLNSEPIGVGELAELAEVSKSTASVFFNTEFNEGEKGGHAKYRVFCQTQSRLVNSLKALNNEFSPCDLCGSLPPGEHDQETD